MKIRKSVTIDKDVFLEVEKIAEREHRNFSNLIEYALREYIERNNKREEPN